MGVVSFLVVFFLAPPFFKEERHGAESEAAGRDCPLIEWQGSH